MLRYQFWGFVLFVFGLYAKNLVAGRRRRHVVALLSGVGGLLGGAIGWSSRRSARIACRPCVCCSARWCSLGVGTLVGGVLVSVAGFAAMLFIGFFSFFLGKISADTIMQQSMPDDFRGRAFALFDIAYNLGFIVPARCSTSVWVEDSPGTTRAILLISGAVFLGLSTLVAAWGRRWATADPAGMTYRMTS